MRLINLSDEVDYRTPQKYFLNAHHSLRTKKYLSSFETMPITLNHTFKETMVTIILHQKINVTVVSSNN